jgi:hypothetical protein
MRYRLYRPAVVSSQHCVAADKWERLQRRLVIAKNILESVAGSSGQIP